MSAAVADSSLMQNSVNAFREQILSAKKNQTPLSIEGGATKNWYGNPNSFAKLSTTTYQGILDYQPEELVITACAGTPLQEIEMALAQRNQVLAFEPPHFGDKATFGGAIAAGLAGPARISTGNLRDFVLGARLLDGRGNDLSFGGKVMKNVAGYDISRLLPGSLGTLALLLEASVKVLPKPAASLTLRAMISQAQALKLLNQWAGQPLPLSASAWIGASNSQQEGELSIRLAGAHAAVSSASAMITTAIGASEVSPTVAAQFWQDLREQDLPCFQITDPGQALYRLALPAACPPLQFPESQLNSLVLEWHGQERWWRGPSAPDCFATLKKLALAQGGHATQFKVSKVSAVNTQRFTLLSENPLTAGLATVQQRLRHAFDPAGIFATGRMA